MDAADRTERADPPGAINPLEALTITHLQPASVMIDTDGAAVVHSPTPALVVLLNGTAELTPAEISLTKDTVVLIPPTQPCCLRGDSGKVVELAALEFNFRFHEIDISLALPKTATVIQGRAGESLVEDICALCHASPASTPGIKETAQRLVKGYRIAIALAEELGIDADQIVSQQDDLQLQQLIRYLQQNYHLPLTIDDIAAECRVSTRQVFNISRRLGAKVTPMRMLKKIRLEKSLELLRSQDTGIGRIAGIVGFADPKNYSKEFKRHYGMTPLQYRQQSYLGVKVAEIMKKADARMDADDPQGAAALYREAMRSAPAGTATDELLYKAGRALQQTGNVEEASEYWGTISSLRYRLLINLFECEYRSKGQANAEIVERLRYIYRYADENLRHTVVERLGEWMLQCNNEDEPEAATIYAEFAKELVGDYPVLKPYLARTLNGIGQYQEVLRLCPDQGIYTASAMRAAGRLEEHLERFPEMRSACGTCLLRLGRLEEVLHDYADQPKPCVDALILLGRAEEAVERYPGHNARALMALGRYEEVLETHPDDSEMCMWALAHLGRVEEALEITGNDGEQQARLLLYLNRPGEILGSAKYERIYRMAASILKAIHLLEKKRYAAALESFESILPMTDSYAYISQGFYHRELLIPAIRFLLRDVAADMPPSRWPNWRTHYAAVVNRFRYCFGQSLWFDMRYILGEINEKTYLSRPIAVSAQVDIQLAKGLKADFRGNHEKALKWYRSFRDAATDVRWLRFDTGDWSVTEAFIRWREKELDG